jgi:hypothetical protein
MNRLSRDLETRGRQAGNICRVLPDILKDKELNGRSKLRSIFSFSMTLSVHSGLSRLSALMSRP